MSNPPLPPERNGPPAGIIPPDLEPRGLRLTDIDLKVRESQTARHIHNHAARDARSGRSFDGPCDLSQLEVSFLPSCQLHTTISGCQNEGDAERDCIRSVAVLPVNEVGVSISLDDSNKRFTVEEKGFEKQIDECQPQEDRSFKVVQVTEYITLCLLILGMVVLVELALRNF